MVPAGNKAKRLSSVNHTTKTIHHHHHLHHHTLLIIILSALIAINNVGQLINNSVEYWKWNVWYERTSSLFAYFWVLKFCIFHHPGRLLQIQKCMGHGTFCGNSLRLFFSTSSISDVRSWMTEISLDVWLQNTHLQSVRLTNR